VYLIIEGSAQGIATFSFFFWSLWVLTSLFLGRAACSYFYPLGAIQEAKDRMAEKPLKRIRYLRMFKKNGLLPCLFVEVDIKFISFIMATVSIGLIKELENETFYQRPLWSEGYA
jgi:polyferredoxin